MPYNTPSVRNLSCFGALLISLGGCAASPDLGGIDMQRMYDRMGAVGQRSAALGSRVWDRTRDALGFDHRAGDELLDEVDLAMMEEDAVLPPSGPSAAERAATLARWERPETTRAELSAGSESLRSIAIVKPGEASADDALLGKRPSPAPGLLRITAPPAAAGNRNDRPPAKASRTFADIRYRVQENESLWTIARTVTGDATNWHRIADINDLAPNAVVYAGQTLTIPGELIDPLPTASETDAKGAAAARPTNTDGSTDSLATTDTRDAERLIVEREAAQEGESPSVAVATPTSESSGKTAEVERVYRIRPGESLWDFAKRVTGDATNWERIAEINHIAPDAVTRVQSGQRIRVPNELIDRAERLTADETASIEAAAATLSHTVDDPDRSRVHIVKADYREKISENGTRQSGSTSQQAVLVRGTYYPKAVYRRADFSSDLLMRVSPGTALKVARAFGPWYEVHTEKGTGYIHARDIR